MSTLIVSSNTMSNNTSRPSTPLRRRCLGSLQCNMTYNVNIEQTLLDFIDRLKDSTDSSTQLLLRLYHHKSVRLNDQPEQLYSFQQEIYSSLRRLHPTIVTSSTLKQENRLCIIPEPIVTGRSAQATIRKLH
ncbi:unnamed protein product [Rotaria socialis]|uniref:Uncharacterized protein n=2 Tax=Rotaria socialis TaxID=392032 RepID=A0A817PPD8_9BILA|nr:unnamed protein product [Rotaria socialis]